MKPHGIAVIQVITMPDNRYESYRRKCDWIQKHVFPGGHLPSLSALSVAMTRSSRLYIEHLENIGPHYAQTLRQWRETFLENADAVEALGFDPSFRRKWEYYLSYCEAGFASRALNTLQIVLSRAGNRQLLRDDERGRAMGSDAVRTSPSTVEDLAPFTNWR